jgi:hypothetical protein
MEIPDIITGDIQIRKLDIPEIGEWLISPPQAIPPVPPVTQQIGVPIVNIPGCVEANKEKNPKNTSLLEDDPKGTITLCDAGTPSFNPIDYDPEQIIPTTPAPVAPVPKTTTPEKPESLPTPEVKAPEVPINTANVECPTPGQQAKEPVGTYLEGFRKKVVAYELKGNECVQITEKVPLPQQVVAGLPSGGQVVQVGGVAVVATTSALLAKPLADLLLKAMKPAVKKVIKKISTLRGKKPPILSVRERQAEQRQMNHAVKALRSVFPRRKRKRKR